MNELWTDRLFQTLWKAKDHLAAWLGCESLKALESYVNGYLDACNEPNGFTARWLHAFAEHLRVTCGVSAHGLSAFGIIRYSGHSDAEGLRFFAMQLEQFAQDRVAEELLCPMPATFNSGEVRAFRVDLRGAMDFAGDYVRDHMEELFGISGDKRQSTLWLDLSEDQILTCAWCSDSETGNNFSAYLPQIAAKLQEQPVFGSGEEIRYETINILSEK